jgi:predicted RNA methylase
MSDWSSDLQIALTSGDPAFMQATLARVPKEVIQRAIPAIERMVTNSIAEGQLEEALTFCTQLISAEPHNLRWIAQRARVHFKLDRLDDALGDANRIVELQPSDALGYRLQAEAYDGLRERKQAVAAYRRVLDFEPNDSKTEQRVKFLEAELRKEHLLKQALDPDHAGNLQLEVPPTPEVSFDPALFADSSLPEHIEKPMIEGLRQHLSRHSGLQSVKDALARLEDVAWTSAWDTALSAVHGRAVLLQGSELGVFAVRAREHGAKQIFVVESSPMDQRVAGGVIQKNLLTAWHSMHGADIQNWSEEQRRSSFESFTDAIQLASPAEETSALSEYQHFVFPNLDHSLLGTGIAKAIRTARSRGLPSAARITPAMARVFAMPIQWRYEGSDFDLDPIEAFRWSLSPQSLEPSASRWTALADPALICTIDFATFEEAQFRAEIPVTLTGKANAVLYWFELELGSARISNAPESELQCIRPAVQYVDEFPVERGQLLTLRATITETRLYFATEPPVTRTRSHFLPSWYVPMLVDEVRNGAYRKSLARALEQRPAALALDIGAGCGLLSMMAAQAGAERVLGCEISRPIADLGKRVIEHNGFAGKIELVNKDLRKMSVSADLPARADLAIFELFDCSMIGEGVLHYLAYAREHLLKEDAKYIPLTGRIRAIIVEYRLNRVLGVDVNLLNPFRFSPNFINVDANKLHYRPLTEPFDVFAFDFSSATPAPEEKEFTVPTIATGVAGAVLFWFDLQLDDINWISNHPETKHPTHWKQGLQFMTEVQIDREASFPLIAAHNGSSLVFKWKPEALSKESFSAVPRFDPRWWQQAKELEHHTHGLLEHCMHHPAEYRKVAELAQRFAVDPANYGLNPLVAQRFAATFFGA